MRLTPEEADAVADALSFYGMASQDMDAAYDEPEERKDNAARRALIASALAKLTAGEEGGPVLSAEERDNATLIRQCAELGYLREDWVTLDPTYGLGVFWRQWQPDTLYRHDLNPAKAPDGVADFTALPYEDGAFDAVVFDPPYKLNGTPSPEDERYGVDVPATVGERMALCRAGVVECARVLKPSGYLLVKCMDQVAGRRHFQSMDFTKVAEGEGCRLVDMLHNLGTPRPQPKGRKQRTSAGNYSTLLVLRKRPRSGRGSRKV